MELKTHGYETLAAIDKMIDSAIEAVYVEEVESLPRDEDGAAANCTAIGLVRTALVYMSHSYLSEFGKTRAKTIAKFQHLVKDNKN